MKNTSKPGFSSQRCDCEAKNQSSVPCVAGFEISTLYHSPTASASTKAIDQIKSYSKFLTPSCVSAVPSTQIPARDLLLAPILPFNRPGTCGLILSRHSTSTIPCWTNRCLMRLLSLSPPHCGLLKQHQAVSVSLPITSTPPSILLNPTQSHLMPTIHQQHTIITRTFLTSI